MPIIEITIIFEITMDNYNRLVDNRNIEKKIYEIIYMSRRPK